MEEVDFFKARVSVRVKVRVIGLAFQVVKISTFDEADGVSK